MVSAHDDFIDLEWTPEKINSIYRNLAFHGYTFIQAGNLIAIMVGLQPAIKGWKPKEINQLLFFKYLNDNRHLEFEVLIARP